MVEYLLFDNFFFFFFETANSEVSGNCGTLIATACLMNLIQ